jgi:APA family basic amino acid/polyamine antiporter
MANSSHESTTLVRRLGPWSSYFLSLGSVVGTGIFLVATDISKSVSSPFAALFVWGLAGLISLMGALIFAELGAMYPRAGGQYAFLREAFHPVLSFLFGWTLVFVIQTGSIAAVAVGFGKFMSSFVPLTDFQVGLVATGATLALTMYNYLGIRRGAQLLDSITSLKLVAIFGFILVIFLMSSSGSVTPVNFDMGGATVSALGVALLGAFWAFDGWYSLTFVAGEIQDPAKNIPRASLYGILTVILLYTLMSCAYFKVLSVEQIQNSSLVAADAAQAVVGQSGATIIGILLLVSAFGCLNTMVISGARVIYAMSKDRLLPYGLSVVSEKTHSPNRALTMQFIWSVILIWSGRYDQLFAYVVFAAFVFYGLTASAVIWLRMKKPNYERPYKVPFYPWLPIVYVVFTIGFTINSLIEKPVESMLGLGIIALGLPAYWYFTSRRRAA